MEWTYLIICITLLTVLPVQSGPRAPSVSSCNSGYVRCGQGDKVDAPGENCIHTLYICDGSQHCEDGSDEAEELCSDWKKLPFTSCSTQGEMYCQYQCFHMWDGCHHHLCSHEIKAGDMCKIVKDKQLPETYRGLELDVETVEMLATAVNFSSTVAVNSQYSELECPMLYVKVGNHCVSFFSLALVPWPEARQFCQSIHGDLLTIEDINMYTDLLDYLREKDLSSDFWLGGRYDMDLNNWCWLDDTPMPSKAPYWALKYSSTCQSRSPGGKCFNYIQSPEQHTQGYCAAITYEKYFYISDEKCSLRKSPLCLVDPMKINKNKAA